MRQGRADGGGIFFFLLKSGIFGAFLLSWRGRGEGGGDQICHFSVLTNCWKKGKNRQNKLKKKHTTKQLGAPGAKSSGTSGAVSTRLCCCCSPFPPHAPKRGKTLRFYPFPPLPRCQPGELRPRGWILLPPHPLRPLPPSPRGPAQVWGRTPSFGDFFFLFYFFLSRSLCNRFSC